MNFYEDILLHDPNFVPHRSPMDPIVAQPSSVYREIRNKNTLIGQLHKKIKNPLHCLEHLDSVIVRRKKTCYEDCGDIDLLNKYEIFDKHDNLIFHAREESSPCSRCCYPDNRPFEMSVINESGGTAIQLSRSFRCCSQVASIFAPIDELIGIVHMQNCLLPKFKITDFEGEVLYTLSGSWSQFMCLGSEGLTLTICSSTSDVSVGTIKKIKSELTMDCCTRQNAFKITFQNNDLEATHKALFIGASIFIDYVWFERKLKDCDD